MPISTSVASPTPRSLWRVCCASRSSRRLTYHRHHHRYGSQLDSPGVAKLKVGELLLLQTTVRPSLD